jgi:diguanylate cyclase (GGDEF)-like protein
VSLVTEDDDGSCGRVLIVDDDPANRDLLRFQLEEQHFEVTTAATGEQCLALAAAEREPEVILLDIQMPGMDGIETCRKLKEQGETARIPVLFVTGHRDDEPTTLEAPEAGGNDFLSKDASTAILVARVKCQITIYRAQAKLRRAAMTDALTGVYSRRFLFDSLRRAIKGMSRQGPRIVACMLIDVDCFKSINDRVGHLAGDRVLRTIASVIDRSTRETDLVARFGGDEFVVIIPDTCTGNVQIVAEKVRRTVEKESEATVSIGLAVLESVARKQLRSRDGVDQLVGQLIEHADHAMYVAKREGRNRVALWAQNDAESLASGSAG